MLVTRTSNLVSNRIKKRRRFSIRKLKSNDVVNFNLCLFLKTIKKSIPENLWFNLKKYPLKSNIPHYKKVILLCLPLPTATPVGPYILSSQHLKGSFAVDVTEINKYLFYYFSRYSTVFPDIVQFFPICNCFSRYSTVFPDIVQFFSDIQLFFPHVSNCL